MARRDLPLTDQRWQLVRRLLHNQDLHIVDRVVLLYAQPLNRITALTVDCVDANGDGIHLHLGSSPVRLPPPLDRLVTETVDRRVGHAATGRTAPNRWLFPGAAPGTLLSSARLGARLRRPRWG
ncbi:hypothetical protein [Micromonospora inyonensis]|uniref:hypothetical protein n=1 Tax=Micromonospora inyonensis TaxID=47866 RepID=UPI00159F09D9|nr:hypothetical protein [Micromonospora inyonensis]